MFDENIVDNAALRLPWGRATTQTSSYGVGRLRGTAARPHNRVPQGRAAVQLHGRTLMEKVGYDYSEPPSRSGYSSKKGKHAPIPHDTHRRVPQGQVNV